MEKTTEELKREASEKNGIPAELIQGETAEEIEAHAAALALYKREYYAAMPTREKFAAWLNGEMPTQEPQETTTDPAAYPTVKDAGETTPTYTEDTRSQFEEWFKDISAFQPRKNRDIFIK